MTHLRKIMLEELQRRHYSEPTTRYYIRRGRSNRSTLPVFSGSLRPRGIFGNTKAQLFAKRKLSWQHEENDLRRSAAGLQQSL